MSSSDYWRQREQAHIAAMRGKDADYDKQLKKFYRSSLISIQKEIDAFYGKYALQQDMTLAEAKKKVSKMDVQAFSEKAKRYVEERDFSDQANEELRLYNATMRINRLELLKSEIGLECVSLGNDVEKYAGDVLSGEAMVEVQRQAGILGMSLSSFDAKRMNEVVSGSYSDASFSQRIWGNNESLKRNLDTLLTQSIIGGKHPDVLARQLQKQFGASQYEARRLMRTESSRIQGKIAMDAYKEGGVEEYEWVAEPTACEVCAPLDGKRWKVNGAAVGSREHPLFPMHPNCRCAVIPVVDEAGEAESSNTDDFIPAASVKDAEEYANQFFAKNFMDKTFKGKADYKGIFIDAANEINQTLQELTSKYNISKLSGIKAVDPESAKGKKVFKDGADAVAAYSPVEHGIYLNPKVLKNRQALTNYNNRASEAWDTVMKNLDTLPEDMQKVALRYKQAGRSLVGDGSIHDYITHEFGHHVAWEGMDAKTNNALGSRMSTYAPKISGYASASKGEYLAESFVAYTNGEISKLDPEYVNAIKNIHTKSSSNVIIKAENEFAHKGTDSIPTVHLPKEEYAHVMSELNTHISDEQRAQFIVAKAIGNYVYTIENYGFNEYRIIGKKKIKAHMERK